jgi:hypothetical protein
VLPKPGDAGRASAARQFENFIDQMAEMLAGKEPRQPLILQSRS